MYDFVKATDSAEVRTSMSVQTVIDGVNLDETLTDDTGLFRTLEVAGRSDTANRIDAVEVRGRPGAKIRNVDRDTKEIKIKFQVKDRTSRGLQRRLDELRELLWGTERPFLFTDDEMTHYGTLSTLEIPSETSNDVTGTITIFCADPDKYGTEQLTDITDGGTVTVRGSAPSVPITEVTLSGPTTFVAIGDGDQINMVGTPLDAEQKPYVREERKFWDQMATTTGWSGTTTSDDGPIVGTIGSSGGEFKPTSYGSGVAWHGPALKKSLGQSIQDFKIDAMMRLDPWGNSGKALSKVAAVHVYLLDAANNSVARINVIKASGYEHGTYVQVRIGNKTEGRTIYHDNSPYNWFYFDGRVSLERVGNRWLMSAIRYTAERGWHAGVQKSLVYNGPYGQAPITQVQVAFLQYANQPVPDVAVSDIKVYKVNERPNEIPYIGDAGDVFVFDHKEGTITKNGMDIEDKKAFIGDYFELSKGSNMMLAEPAESISRATVRWRDRWI